MRCILKTVRWVLNGAVQAAPSWNRTWPPSSILHGFTKTCLPIWISGILNVDVDVKGPTFVGDTIYVHCEVIESKLTSKADRGLVRTQNTVKNASGNTVLIYRPLRLIKLISSQGGISQD